MLARTPAPHKFEAVPSYLLRLAVANGLKSPARIYNRLRPSRLNRQLIGARFSLEDLSALTGRSADELSSLGQTCTATGLSALRAPTGPKILDPADRRPLSAPMHCPECAEENGSIDATWSLGAISVCVRHQRFGIAKCDACGAAIRWERRAMNACDCGRSFMEAPRFLPSYAEMACADILRASLLPAHQLDDLPQGLGFPVEALRSLEFPILLSTLGLLAQFWSGVTKDDEPKSETLCRAGAVLRQWPYRFWVLLRRSHRDLGDLGLVNLLFDRNSGLINREIRRESLDLNRHRFLIDAARQYIEKAGLVSLVDRRIMVKICGAEEPAQHSVHGVSKQVGMDARALQSLAERGAIPTIRNAKGKLVVNPSDVATVKEAWSAIGIREASRVLGMPVRTFRCCIAEGLIRPSSLQSKLRGYSAAEVQSFGDHLDTAAAQCHACLGDDGMDVSKVMHSSRYTTECKFSLVRNLLAGHLTDLANGSTFNALRVHISVLGIGSMASSPIKRGEIVGTYASQMLMCSLPILEKLVSDELIKGSFHGREIYVDLRSLRRFASRWISDVEICNSIGWVSRPRGLPAMLGKVGTSLRYGKAAFFVRRHVPDVRSLALLAFGES